MVPQANGWDRKTIRFYTYVNITQANHDFLKKSFDIINITCDVLTDRI